jgi:hypothetical protein
MHTQKQIATLLQEREEFTGSNFYGFTFVGRYIPDAAWVDHYIDGEYSKFLAFIKYMDYLNQKNIENKQCRSAVGYIVKSYNTPIAWGELDDELYITESKFSSTTSRHQSVVRRNANVHIKFA